MNTAEILQAKDLRIQVLEEQLTACKSDRKRLKKQLKLYGVSNRRELLIDLLDKLENTQDEAIPTNTYEEIADKYLQGNL